MLAVMKTKTFTVLNTLTKAVIKTESILEQYKSRCVHVVEVQKSFQRLSEVMEKSRRMMQKAISGSSVGSTDFTETNNGSPVEEWRLAVVQPPPPLVTGDENYYEMVQAPMPVQETEHDTTDLTPETSRRRQKPKPLPRTKYAQTALLKQAPPNLADEENDFTGGTGDSGVGSGESDRMTWIKHSQLPGREIEGSAKRYPQEIGYYTPLVGRREITDINEYATPMPIRANSADNLLIEELKKSLKQ